MKLKSHPIALILFAVVLAKTSFAEDQSSVIVPMKIASEGPRDFMPSVNISVAGGPSTSVLFDTGSVGLHIFADKVGSQNIRYTNTHVSNQYGDGVVYEGVIAFAPVCINGIATAPIPIVVVQKAYCSASKPRCLVVRGDPNEPAPHDGFYGVMGVAMRPKINVQFPDQSLYSPLRALPDNYASGFIIQNWSKQGGQIVIGLNPSNRAGFNYIQLPKVGVYPDGQAYYKDRGLSVQYTIGGIRQNFDTIFDTGGNAQVHFFAKNPGFPARGKIVKPGTAFSASLPNVFNWNLTTGNIAGVNTVSFKPNAGSRGVLNTGITFFFDYDVLYDYQNGRLGFRPHNV
jgi:hypothetical protein